MASDYASSFDSFRFQNHPNKCRGPRSGGVRSVRDAAGSDLHRLADPAGLRDRPGPRRRKLPGQGRDRQNRWLGGLQRDLGGVSHDGRRGGAHPATTPECDAGGRPPAAVQGGRCHNRAEFARRCGRPRATTPRRVTGWWTRSRPSPDWGPPIARPTRTAGSARGPFSLLSPEG